MMFPKVKVLDPVRLCEKKQTILRFTVGCLWIFLVLLSNGVELSQDEQFLFVAETGGYRIWKIAVKSDQTDIDDSPQATVLLDNLPGGPDNVTRGLDGRIWFGIPKQRTSGLDRLAAHPGLRKVLVRLPKSLWPLPKQYGHVAAFNEEGDIVVDLQDPLGASCLAE